MSDRKIVIVGGGVAGVATAFWLAEHGARRVVLLERERSLGMHSSGLNAAILRTSSANEVVRALALETATFLASPPPGFADAPLLERSGVIVYEGTATDPEPVWAQPLLAAGQVEQLVPERASSLAPHVRPDGERAWLFPNEGRIDISRLVDSFAQGAADRGVEIASGAPVTEIRTEASRVYGVQLADGTHVDADTVVIAAGGWAAQLGRTAGSRLAFQATRRHLLVTRVDERVDPSWPIVWDERAGFYARPESGGLLLCVCDETDVDPDDCRAETAVKTELLQVASRLIPGLADAGTLHFWAGMRTFAPDRDPVVGEDPDVDGLFWVGGLGGGGMSTCAGLGRVAAQGLLGEHPCPPELDPRRFARDATEVSGRA